jgi:hypothetical protein
VGSKKLTAEILKRHGARPDVRLFRNEAAGAWVGKTKGRTTAGDVILQRGAKMIQAGLAPGSADLIGFKLDESHVARFVSIEVKTGSDRLRKGQRAWRDLMERMGALWCVARSVEDVDDLLGPPPGESE